MSEQRPEALATTDKWLASRLPSCIKNGIPSRYKMTIIAFFGFILNYMLRINMNIAIVAMVIRNHTSNFNGNGTELNQTTHHEETSTTGEFYWDDKTQSLIFGSFFWGYLITQIPGGRFAEVFGSKYLFGFSILLSGVATVLIPLLAEQNPIKLICLRFVLGLLEGATYPSMHALLSRWAPPNERSRMASIVYSGSQAGTVLCLPLSGLLISLYGWRFVFYVIGSLPAVWFLFWMYFVYDSPKLHPRISSEERVYIEKSLEDGNSGTQNNANKTVPWLKICTSLPFMAILAAGLGSNWGFWTLLQLLPTYMSTILHFDIKKNSILSAVPYLAMWFFGLGYGVFSDYLKSSGILSTKNVRKLSTFICMGLPGIALLIVTLVGEDKLSTLIVFTFAVAMSGGKYSSYLSNHLDIAPNYAGTLLGIANAFSTIPGWLAPITAAAFTNENQTLEQWHKVFYIASGIYGIGCILFFIFASGEVQPWNNNKNGSSTHSSNSCSSNLDKSSGAIEAQIPGSTSTTLTDISDDEMSTCSKHQNPNGSLV